MSDEYDDLTAVPAEDEFSIDREGFDFYHANLFTGWLSLVPRTFNTLVSFANIEEADPYKGLNYLVWARSVMLDSGFISALVQMTKGKMSREHAVSRLDCQPQLMDLAWRIWGEEGVEGGWVCAIDQLAGKTWVEVLGCTVDDAIERTVTNAAAFRVLDAPPTWGKVYCVQGQSVEQYVACMDGFDQVGVLDDIRAGTARLAIGSLASRGGPPALYTIVEAVRERLGPDGWIHALGIGAPKHLRYLVGRGWIQSADSSRPTMLAARNDGPYRVEGPRRFYMYLAQMAAGAELFEKRLYEELHAGERARKAGVLPIEELQESLL